MLSSNSLLRQGRYRVSQLAASSGTQTVYEAQDNLVAQTVLICEKSPASKFGGGIMPRHDGLVQIADRFDEGGYRYLATEALMGSGPWSMKSESSVGVTTDAVLSRVRTIIEAVRSIRKHYPTVNELDITPLHFRATKDGAVRLAFFESAAPKTSMASESPYRAIESVWDSLDLASQKAITQNYDEAANDDLEKGPDERTDMYAVGAVFYQILTSRTPPSALERSIELLDSGKDPLTRPDSLNADVAAPMADALMKMMSLRRNDRFASLEAAAASFGPPASRVAVPVPAAPAPASARPAFELDEDLDLLEIPTPAATPSVTVANDAASVAVTEEASVAASSVASTETFDVSEELIEEHPEPFIDEVEPLIEALGQAAPATEAPAAAEAESEVVNPSAEVMPAKVAELVLEPAQAVQPRQESVRSTDFSLDPEPKSGAGKMVGIAIGAVAVIADNERRTGAPRRIDRCVGHRD